MAWCAEEEGALGEDHASAHNPVWAIISPLEMWMTSACGVVECIRLKADVLRVTIPERVRLEGRGGGSIPPAR